LPGVARAQQTSTPVIGFLGSETSALWADRLKIDDPIPLGGCMAPPKGRVVINGRIGSPLSGAQWFDPKATYQTREAEAPSAIGVAGSELYSDFSEVALSDGIRASGAEGSEIDLRSTRFMFGSSPIEREGTGSALA